jgi:hypothetical protein
MSAASIPMSSMQAAVTADEISVAASGLKTPWKAPRAERRAATITIGSLLIGFAFVE